MATKTKSTIEQSEAFAKNWQVDNLRDDISNVAKLVAKIDNKMDNKFATKEQLDVAVQLVRKDYDPIRRNLSRITWIVIGVVVPLIVVSGIQLLSNVTRSV